VATHLDVRAAESGRQTASAHQDDTPPELRGSGERDVDPLVWDRA
jgi:hypothetical protein